MKKTLVAVALTAGSLCLMSGAALADPSSGDPHNCVGQTTRYVVQGNPIDPFISAQGLGNVAKANGVSTKDAMGFIKFIIC